MASNGYDFFVLSIAAGIGACALRQKGREWLAEFWILALKVGVFLIVFLVIGTSILALLQLGSELLGWNVHLLPLGDSPG